MLRMMKRQNEILGEGWARREDETLARREGLQAEEQTWDLHKHQKI